MQDNRGKEIVIGALIAYSQYGRVKFGHIKKINAKSVSVIPEVPRTKWDGTIVTKPAVVQFGSFAIVDLTLFEIWEIARHGLQKRAK